MATIEAKAFRGILTKGNLVSGDPDRDGLVFVKEAVNCILNKGDLCNGPVILEAFSNNHWTPQVGYTSRVVYEYLFKRLFNDPGIPEEVYEDYFQKYIIVLLDYNLRGDRESNLYFMSLPDLFNPNTGSIGFLQIGRDFSAYNICNLRHKDIDRFKASSSNMISIGDWIFILGEFGIPDKDPTPRILRFKMSYTNHISYYIQPRLQFVGVKAPNRVVYYAAGDGNDIDPAGDYSFAFTFVTASTEAYDGTNALFIDENNALGEEDIESNAVRLFDATGSLVLATKDLEIKIVFPEGYPASEIIEGFNSKFRLGVYVRKDNEVNYSFYTYAIVEIVENAGDWSIIYTLPISITDRNPLKIAPFTDIVPELGAHDVPPPCRHGCYFFLRMYYASLKTPLNEIYYSQTPPDDDPNEARYACYIEGKFLVGDANDPITGMIEYLGQMIIFKLNSIYVLTGDIEGDSELRRLFSGLGCVNVLGGKAYIEVNNILYFVSTTGIYMFAGDQPIKISEQIQEELDKIDRARYGFCRVSVDQRYNLLYFSFPVGYKGSTDFKSTFIYNYVEGGWTRQDSDNSIIQVLPATTANEAFGVYHSTPLMFTEVGIIDDKPQAGFEPPNFSIETGLISLGKEERIKHFKMFRLNRYPLEKTSFEVLDKNFGRLDIIETLENEYHIGIYKKLILLSLVNAQNPMESIANGKFRITGYSLSAHITGRR